MRRFLNREEFLLVCTYHEGHGFQWLGDPERRYLTAWDVLADWNEDGIVEFRRVDIETWVGEDVTEDIAAAWIAARRSDITPEDAEECPAYVASSQAWTDFVDGYEQPEDFSPAAMIRSNGSHHTHNGRVVG